ncbi:hypothetical protein COCOBI_03-0340 [Coccomyxa sp. Obi]|nr:hypothetical protein COCOBI_03-0340 [Coccomyxa sp. Obi]
MAGEAPVVNFQGLLEGAHEGEEECVPLETWERRNPVSPGCKMCVGCQTEKPFSEFHKSKRRYDGLNTYCKACAKKLHATWRASRPGVAPCVASKNCGGCKQTKPASEFHADRKRTDGLQTQCKDCTSALHKRWRDERRREDRPVAESKTCKACEETKPADEFYRDARAADGLQSRCRQCTSQYYNLWQQQRRLAAHPEVARHKVCAICGQDKRAEEFRLAREGTSEDGLVANCKECTAAQQESSDCEPEQAAVQQPQSVQPSAGIPPEAPNASEPAAVPRPAAQKKRARGAAATGPADTGKRGRGHAAAAAAAGPATDAAALDFGSAEPLPAGSPVFGSSFQDQVMMASNGPWQHALDMSYEEFSSGL